VKFELSGDRIMKIAMIGSKGIPFLGEGGGIERHVEELSTRFAEAGHEVSVYVRPRAVSRRGEWRGVRLIRLPSIPTKHLDTITHVFLATLHALFQNYDIFHYHGVGPSTLSWLPRLLAPRAKVIVTFHSQDRFHKKWGLLARIFLAFGEWTAIAFPHKTIVVSRTLERYVRERFGARAAYIPNGVAVVSPKPSMATLRDFGLKPDCYLLTVARLIRHKGIHFLIQAFSGLAGDWQLVVVGAPSYTEDYSRYLLSLGRSDPRIKFVGFRGGAELSALYSYAALYVHPSESEGLSLSILEAMGHGTAVLISDIPENLETIDHSGFSFKNADVLDLRRELERVLGNPELRRSVGERGRKFVSQHFSWQMVANETLNEYQRALTCV
jgi:glycosyltransferase involved in cell wall biosynthesis